MITKRLSENEYGDPKLVVTVTGTIDVYRFARFLEHGQVEFARIGRSSLRSLGKKIGRARFRAIVESIENEFRYFGEVDDAE